MKRQEDLKLFVVSFNKGKIIKTLSMDEVLELEVMKEFKEIADRKQLDFEIKLGAMLDFASTYAELEDIHIEGFETEKEAKENYYMNELVRLTAEVPRHIRADFKVICAKKGIDMKDILKELLEKYIQENEEVSN